MSVQAICVVVGVALIFGLLIFGAFDERRQSRKRVKRRLRHLKRDD